MNKPVDNLPEKHYNTKDKTDTAFRKAKDLKRSEKGGSVTMHISKGTVQKVEVIEFF